MKGSLGRIRGYVAEQIDRNERLLATARNSYQRTGHESWGGRMAELQGIVNELKLVLGKIEREIEYSF